MRTRRWSRARKKRRRRPRTLRTNKIELLLPMIGEGTRGLSEPRECTYRMCTSRQWWGGDDETGANAMRGREERGMHTRLFAQEMVTDHREERSMIGCCTDD